MLRLVTPVMVISWVVSVLKVAIGMKNKKAAAESAAVVAEDLLHHHLPV
jgi:hypothetical protein